MNDKTDNPFANPDNMHRSEVGEVTDDPRHSAPARVRWECDEMGRMRPIPADIDEMFSPVRCSWCFGVYDLGKVTVTARYLDCSVWKAPCCGREVDSRDGFFKPRPDYIEGEVEAE